MAESDKLETGRIVSMIYADKSTLLLADSNNIYKYSIPDGTTSLFIKDCTNIPDMTNVGSNHFAFIDQGTWFYSYIYQCKIVSGETVLCFMTDTYCSGIAFSENHYFLTFSTADKITLAKSYVKMVDENGKEKKVIKVGDDEENLFSRRISKIFVNSNSDMYVVNINKKSLRLIRFNIQGQARVVTDWEEVKANDISCKDDKPVLALGNWKNDIVIIYDKSSKNIVKRSKLKGEPTAICVVGNHIFVATKRGWWSPQFYIQFSEIIEAKREDHCLTM